MVKRVFLRQVCLCSVHEAVFSRLFMAKPLPNIGPSKLGKHENVNRVQARGLFILQLLLAL